MRTYAVPLIQRLTDCGVHLDLQYARTITLVARTQIGGQLHTPKSYILRRQ